MLYRLLQQTFSLLFPCSCLICNRRLKSSAICSACQPPVVSQLNRCPRCFSLSPENACKGCLALPTAISSVRFLWLYDAKAGAYIRTMKYKPSSKLARMAAVTLSTHLPKLYQAKDWDLAVPIPLSTLSRRQRQFNQCTVLARCVSQSLSLPLSHTALREAGPRLRQASLSRKERIANAAGAFYAVKQQVRQRRILLIDDVITTGSTAAAAASSLMEAGAKRVDLLALARSPLWDNPRQIAPSLLQIQANGMKDR